MPASDISSFSAVTITTSIIIITGRHYSVVNSGDYQVRVNPSVSEAAVLAGKRWFRSFKGRLQISRRHEVEFGGNGEEESRGWRRRSSFTCRSLFKLEPSVMRFFFFFFLITGGVEIADAERPRWVSSTARSTASQKRTSLGLFLGQTPGRTQNLQEGLHISSGSGISCWDPPGRTEGSSWGDGRLDCSASPAWWGSDQRSS